MRQLMRTVKSENIWKAKKDKTDHPCIWMQAGVAKKKNCNNFYDCTNCKYDDSMDKMAKAGKHISWQDALRNRDSRDRTCRHALTNRTEHRTCPMNYNCRHCEFDQCFEDTISPKTGHSMVYMKDVKGFNIADGYYFHSGHTWASIDSGGLIRIGLDDFSFKVLGGPDAFDLPLTGQELNKDKVGWGLKRKENLADILSPVNGVITEVNHNIRKSSDIAKNDPYGDGWLFTIHNPDIKGTVQDLMADNDSEEWLGQEVATLENMIEKVTGPLSADGGLLKTDVYGNLPTLGWHNLTRTFLRT
ncbi:MAG: glycine cleavage system protein H [Deltaproteobacteria bacterium]|nr:glycine cleavage system protein H [Deltaproteobacteria bacterium]